MNKLKVISAATGLPVSVAEFKTHLGIYHTEKDDNLTILLNASVKKAENVTGRVLFTGGQIMEASFSDFNDVLEIETAPVTGVTSVKYFDGSNTEQTLGSSNYDANLDAVPAELTFDNPPAVYGTYRHNAVKVRFVAGYADADAVPDDIKAAILLMGQNMYDNPGDSVRQLTSASENILKNYKVH